MPVVSANPDAAGANGRRLLGEGSAALKMIDVARPASVSNAFEELLRLTGLAVIDYCGHLNVEVETFCASTLPTLSEGDRDEILSLTTKHADANLYLTRFDKFGEAVERQFGRAGRQVDAQAFRPDLFRSRLQVGTLNAINRSLAALKDDLDLRILATQSAQPASSEANQPPKATEPEQPKAGSALRSKLLIDLFRQARAPHFVVDRRSFRAKHHEQLRTLDEMASNDDIRDNQGFYTPALMGLSKLTTYPEVRQLLDDCDLVLRVLRDRYLSNQVDMVAAEELAKQAGIERDRFDRALTISMKVCRCLEAHRARKRGAKAVGTWSSPEKRCLS